jgi:hypothetical protein
LTIKTVAPLRCGFQPRLMPGVILLNHRASLPHEVIAMSTDADTKKTLLQNIGAKRSEIRSFLSKTEPRNVRLVNMAIICSAIAAALTAGPAFGGKTLTAWLETLGLRSPVWQLLCLGATACSVAAVVVTNMSKSHEITSKLFRAQTTDAKLEGLEALVQMDQIEIDKASSLYVQT